jgi:hypothetical protein
MNSSFYHPNFEKHYKSAKADFPFLYDPKRITTEPNTLLNESSSEGLNDFLRMEGVTSESSLLNSWRRAAAPHPVARVQSEIEEVFRKRELVEATAQFFREKVPSPEFFGTHTFDKEVRKESAVRILLEYFRTVAKRIGSHFRLAWGGGYQACRRAYHFHFLSSRIPNDAELVSPTVSANDLMEPWRYGISKVEPYDFEKGNRDRGAFYYVADHEDTDVWVACARTKRCKGPDGCKVERSIWKGQ